MRTKESKLGDLRNRKFKRLAAKYLAKAFLKNDGSYVMREDWDNLIILDACRYDSFEKLNWIDGRLEHRVSRGANTVEFLQENFRDYYGDVVYVTANPWPYKKCGNKFHKIVNVWDGGWSDELQTIHPKTVNKYVTKARLKHPNKRYIIHYMQPHTPFLRDDLRWIKPYHLERGDVSLNTYIEGYNDNLRRALIYVEKLIKKLDGKTVVTADHGEGFGEKLHPLIPKRIWSHCKYMRIESLVKIPWLVIE